MRPVVQYIAKGRIQGVATATTLATLAPLFFPFYWPSGAVIGLFTLRYGSGEGAVLLAITSSIYLVMTWLLFKSTAFGLGMLISVWLPVYGLCCVLRMTRSQGMSLTLAGIVAAMLVVAFHVGVDDAVAWWQPRLDLFFQVLAERIQVSNTSDLLAQREVLVTMLAPVMTGVILTGILFSAVIMMLLARWCHAILDNPGGFAKEFRNLRLDGRFALVMVAFTILALLTKTWFTGLATELLAVVMVLLFFQGLAVVHSIVAKKSLRVGWLGAMYLLWLLATPQVTIVIVFIGLVDATVDIRARLFNISGPT